MHARLDELRCYLCRVLHSWRRIDLYEPNFQFFIDHEVISKYFKAILSVLNIFNDAFERLGDYFTHLRLYSTIEDLFPVDSL